MAETSNEEKTKIIQIDKDTVAYLKDFLCNKRDECAKTKDSNEKNKIYRLMKDEIIDFFENYDLDIDESTKLNKIDNITYGVQCDIKKARRAAHNNFQNMVWGTIKEDDIGYDIWWICWSEEGGIYVFELPEDKGFELGNFAVTSTTRHRNNRYYDKYKRRWVNPPQSADIVLDMQDDRFQEVLGFRHGDVQDFKDYLRAKLDFNTNQLFVYPEKNPVTPQEYEERRQKFMEDLNDEQRNAATTDIKSSLIVAGAGCGKTHTLMGRVIHLYENGLITSPDDLLLVVFNKKNRKDFRKKLKKLGFAEYAKKSAHTFHSLGCSIIKATGKPVSTFDQDNDEPLDVLLKLFEDYNYRPTNRLLADKCKKIAGRIKQITEDKQWLDGLFKWTANTLPNLDNEDFIRLMGLYKKFIPNEKQRVLAAKLDKIGVCLDTDNYRFKDEDEQKMKVLNYLLLSGYTKEHIAHINQEHRYIQIKTPDYKEIYWEDYNCDRNFDGIENDIQIIRQLSENEIEEILRKAVIRSRMRDFRETAMQFISLCKIYHDDNFGEFAKYTKEILHEPITLGRISPEHVDVFYELIPHVYEAYKEFLGNELDFNDMINVAVDKLEEEFKRSEYQDKFKYKYILVDEFQDVAYDTFKLVKALRDRNDASIMCVGDDWQAIYSWKGSDLKFFNDFKNRFGIADADYKEFRVTTTYRYGQNLANVSDKFIRSKPNEKTIKAAEGNPNTRLIEWGANLSWNDLIKKIEKENTAEISIKVLQRRNYDAENVTGKSTKDLTSELQKKFNNRKDTTDVLTIHKSKGLEADVVIILDLWGGVLPSEKTSDPILVGLHKKFNATYDAKAEERRLFYVAMTRAKKACYFYHPSGKFWEEIKDDPNIEHE